MFEETTMSHPVFTPLDLSPYKHLFVLTGAGVSVASGLSTYRGPGGLWEKAEVARIADARNLPETLPELWRLYSMRRRAALEATPNGAHQAIADLHKRYEGEKTVIVVTQNVDGLHQRSGAQVIELHGSAFRTRCTNPRCPSEPFADTNVYETVPLCPVCGEALRPDVVLFGESLNRGILERVIKNLAECDLFLSVGTSGVVWPAAEFVRGAASVGARTISVNVESAIRQNPAYREEYLGPAETVLPALFGFA